MTLHSRGGEGGVGDGGAGGARIHQQGLPHASNVVVGADGWLVRCTNSSSTTTGWRPAIDPLAAYRVQPRQLQRPPRHLLQTQHQEPHQQQHHPKWGCPTELCACLPAESALQQSRMPQPALLPHSMLPLPPPPPPELPPSYAACIPACQIGTSTSAAALRPTTAHPPAHPPPPVDPPMRGSISRVLTRGSGALPRMVGGDELQEAGESAPETLLLEVSTNCRALTTAADTTHIGGGGSSAAVPLGMPVILFPCRSI